MLPPAQIKFSKDSFEVGMKFLGLQSSPGCTKRVMYYTNTLAVLSRRHEAAPLGQGPA